MSTAAADRDDASTATPERADDPLAEAIWEYVRADYRAGLSLGRISEKYGLDPREIARRRRAGGWRRDLRDDVRREVSALLAADAIPLGRATARSDDDLIEAAARAGAEVVRQHRRVLRMTCDTAMLMVRQLRLIAEGREPEVPAVLGARGPTEAMLHLAQSLARLVPLERQAHGLDSRAEERPYEDRLREWRSTVRAMARSRSSDGDA